MARSISPAVTTVVEVYDPEGVPLLQQILRQKIPLRQAIPVRTFAKTGKLTAQFLAGVQKEAALVIAEQFIFPEASEVAIVAEQALLIPVPAGETGRRRPALGEIVDSGRPIGRP